jgi:hypothetical protein
MMEQRGVISLDPRSWTTNNENATSDIYPPFLNVDDTDCAFVIDPLEGVATMNWMQVHEPATNRADVSIGGLLLETLREGSTVAQAVQRA